MEHIFKEIHNERERQEKKWGEQNHPPIEYCAILGEEVGEVNKAALEWHFGYFVESKDLMKYGPDCRPSEYRAKEYRKELIQTAAVAIAMIQSLERNNPEINFNNSK